MTEELCTNCKKPIPLNESACVLDGKVVCQSCDAGLRNTISAAAPKEPDNTLAAAVSVICSLALIVEVIVLIVLFGLRNDPSLPDGPLEMALNMRLVRHDQMTAWLFLDIIAIITTVCVLMLAQILHAVNRAAHYLSHRRSQ